MTKNKRKKFRPKKKFYAIVQMQREKPYKWRYDSIISFKRFINKEYYNYRYIDYYCNITKEFSHRETNINYSNRQYKCIIKVSNNQFKTLHTDNLKEFTNYLDKTYFEWRYFNVFKTKTGIQKASFTRKNRPISKTI